MKTLKISLIISLMSFFFASSSLACGWSEYEETVRLALFKAEIKGFYSLRPFIYCANHVNTNVSDPDGLDQQKNCQEWQEKVGKSVSVEDINQILYKTEPELFECAYQENSLTETFEENAFATFLSKTENKAFLEYLVFAKMLEYKYSSGNGSRDWESWEETETSISTEKEIAKRVLQARTQIENISDNFLKTRYAFLIMREFYQNEEYVTSLEWNEKYFGNTENQSIINKWALFFKGFCLDKTNRKAEANYHYSLAFAQCYNKKFVSYEYFNKEADITQNALSFAKNKTEKANLLALSIINTPSPQLKMLEKIAELDLQSPYLAFLVGREINKLEDWIFTPTFTEYPPSVQLTENSNYDKWDTYHKTATEKNYLKDIAYLNKLKAFLQKIYPKMQGENHDFYAMAIAHLCFISDKVDEGKTFLNQISTHAPAQVLAQKNLDLALILLKEADISQVKTKESLGIYLNELAKSSQKNYEINKQIYSLVRIISAEYKKKGDIVTAGLLLMWGEKAKSKYEQVRYEYGDSEYYGGADYALIAYFDLYADIRDMNQLLELLQKKPKNRTNFEKFLCAQNLPSVNFCKDLKGTIAFRNNNWELAHHTFSQIPDTFWQKFYAYKDFLNEDPFVPKAWQYTSGYTRKFDYKFNKTDFLAELLRLRKEAMGNYQKAAENYIKLGHALYNCSFWGNSWMMTMYGQSSSNPYYEFDYVAYTFGSMKEKLNSAQCENYLKCSEAKKYYQLALSCAKNDEQKAMANFMTHICEYNAYLVANRSWNYYDSHGKSQKHFNAGKSLQDFYKKYNHTQVFQQFHCPLLDEFVN